MTRTQNILLTALTLIPLLSIGCAHKNTDGTYSSAYSYHPYVKKERSYYTYSHNYQTQRFYRNSSSSITNNIERVAKSLLGTDYKYGANGPYQYDCSSFTKYVFEKNGIRLPRISRDQAKVGKYVNVNELQKGDLIFFDSKKSSEVSHVGIYLGGGYFIHASSAKDQVTISNLNSNYYKKHFKWGRRVTNLYYARR